jgi:two-component system response regulator HydG
MRGEISPRITAKSQGVKMDQKLSILIVDDDRRITRTLSDILNVSGYQTTEASSGPDALEKVRSMEFDCVISDIKMPDMDGVELHRHLHDIQPGLPVILMTAYAADALTHQGLDEGVVGVLDKPLDINHLLVFLSSLSKNRTIVIVDDDIVFCKTLDDILHQRGFKVAQINDPRMDVNLMTTDAQVILLDFKFDGINGLEVLKQIRKNNPTLPVLMVTGYRKEMIAAIQAALEINAYTCIYKPLEIPQLLQMLTELQITHLRDLLKIM